MLRVGPTVLLVRCTGKARPRDAAMLQYPAMILHDPAVQGPRPYRLPLPCIAYKNNEVGDTFNSVALVRYIRLPLPSVPCPLSLTPAPQPPWPHKGLAQAQRRTCGLASRHTARPTRAARLPTTTLLAPLTVSVLRAKCSRQELGPLERQQLL